VSARTSAATFVVHSRLGVGGFGEVQLATMKKAGKEEQVALKRVRADLAESPEYVMQFEREARISSVLDHPNVVRLLDWGTDDTGPYLALEFVHGLPSSKLIDEFRRRDERLPLPVALSICRDAARGLVYAHQLTVGDGRGLIHRDISPDNILVAYAGDAKLADFGIARGVDSTRMTSTGVTKGKLGFMAPELLDAAPPSFRSDLFAFAVTIYELIAGVQPFGGKTEAEIIAKVLRCAPRPLGDVCEVPREVEAWVMQALKKSVKARPESAHPVLLALEAECAARAEEGHGDVRACMRELWPLQAGVPLAEMTSAPTRVKAAPTPSAQSRRNRQALILGGAMAATAVGFTAYLLSRDLSGLHEARAEIDANARTAPLSATQVDVRIESDPPGATVQLEGARREGKTPLTLERLRPGQKYRLDVYLPGWFAWSETIVADGTPVRVKLEKLPVQQR
jgi:eukaryotic-like serine/threonine-protein kinase